MKRPSPRLAGRRARPCRRVVDVAMRQPDARATAFAAATVRLWTRVDTSRPAGRCPHCTPGPEIQSDLWEFVHDPDCDDGWHRSVHILLRLMRGVADDLRWRLTLDWMTATAVRVGAALTAALLVFIAWWVLDLMRTRFSPSRPIPPRLVCYPRPSTGASIWPSMGTRLAECPAGAPT